MSPKDAMASSLEPITINSGRIIGDAFEDAEPHVRVYRGIPYAQAPVGNLRWAPPAPVTPWDGVRECRSMPPSAPQTIGRLQISLSIPQSEDCLNLNVLTPAKSADERLPVMVWLHGGAYIHGNANEEFFNAPRLPRRGVVLVNVNMRVGPFGLLAHPLLSQQSPHGVSGNYMVLDMIAALHWVKANIAAFGGNPDNVTIFGESGGGGKVLTLMCSPLASGLFHKAIIESGGVIGTLNGRPMADQEEFGARLFAELGVSHAADPLAAARALPWKAIVEADRALVEKHSLSIIRWNTTIDGWVLSDSTARLIKTGSAPNWTPVIAGCNLGEIDGSGDPLLNYPSLIQANVNVASSAGKKGLGGYLYLFDRVPPGWRKGGCVSFHRLEPGYVFGDWDDHYGFFSSDAFPLARASGAKQEDPELDDADRRVSEDMMDLWTQFARTGVPSIAGRIDWPAFDRNTDNYLLIKDPLVVAKGYSKLPG